MAIIRLGSSPEKRILWINQRGEGVPPTPPYIFCVNGEYPPPLIERGGGLGQVMKRKLSEVSPPQGPSRGTAGRLPVCTFPVIARRGGAPSGAAGGILILKKEVMKARGLLFRKMKNKSIRN